MDLTTVNSSYGDLESRHAEAVVRTEHQLLQDIAGRRIAGVSTEVESRLRTVLDSRELREADAPDEVSRRALRASEARANVAEEDLRRIEWWSQRPNDIPVVVETTYTNAATPASNITGPLSYNFNTSDAGGFQWRDLNVKSSDQVFGVVRRATTVADLNALGITVTIPGGGIPTTPKLDEAVLRQIANLYAMAITPYTPEMRQLLQSGGVGEFNVQAALQIARSLASEDPRALMEAMGQINGATSQELARTRAKLSIQGELTLLEGIPSPSKPRDQAQAILDAITRDSTAMTAPVRGAVDPVLQPLLGGRTTYPPDTDKAAFQQVQTRIVELRNENAAVVGQYRQIEDALVRVAEQIERGGMTLPAAGDITGVAMTSASPPARPAVSFTDRVDVRAAAQMLRDRYASEPAEDLRKQITAAAAPAARPSGKEAILNLYQKHFERGFTRVDTATGRVERESGTANAPDVARRLAHEYYGRNGLAHRDVQETTEYVTSNEFLQQPRAELFENYRWFDGPAQYAKELVNGRQETYLCNIAKAMNVPMPMFTWTGMGPLRYGWNHRPRWESANYPALLTCFYAIRDSVRRGAISNTPYVRDQLASITRLLSQKYWINVIRDFDLAPNQTPQQRMDREASVPESERRARAMNLLVNSQPQGEVAANVDRAIKYTKANTAWKRRFAAERVKDLVGANETTWYNPLTWPSGAVKGGWWATKATAVAGYENRRKLTGAAAGAAVGTLILPGLGTIVGAAIGWWNTRKKAKDSEKG